MPATMLIPANAGCLAGLDYLPTKLEAERMATFSQCRMTFYKAIVAGQEVLVEDAGRCPTCGGVHGVVDVFATPAEMAAAASHKQEKAMGAYRGDDGQFAFGLLGGTADGATVKGMLGYNPAVYHTKDVGNDFPGAVRKG